MLTKLTEAGRISAWQLCQKTTLQFTCLSETFLLIQESNEFIDKKKENQLKIIVTDADEKETDADEKETCADEKETCAVIYIMCNIAECVLPRHSPGKKKSSVTWIRTKIF